MFVLGWDISLDMLHLYSVSIARCCYWPVITLTFYHCIWKWKLLAACLDLQLWNCSFEVPLTSWFKCLPLGTIGVPSRCVYSFCLFFTFDITRYSGHVLCPGNVLLDLFKYCGHHHSIEEGSNYTPHFVRNGDESSCFPSLSIGIYIIPRTACNFQLPVEKRLSLSA